MVEWAAVNRLVAGSSPARGVFFSMDTTYPAIISPACIQIAPMFLISLGQRTILIWLPLQTTPPGSYKVKFQ
jgi:hypothetical protein